MRILYTVIFLFLISVNVSFAGNIEIDALRLDTQTLKSGYTINGFVGKFRVGIFPEVLAVETSVTLKNFYSPMDVLPIPADKQVVSNIYEFDIFLFISSR